MPSITSKRRQLPSIEEAWNLPISAEMSSRQQQNAQANQRAKYAQQQQQQQQQQAVMAGTQFAGAAPGMRPNGQTVVMAGRGMPQPQPQPTPPFYLNAQQLQMLQYLQKNVETLTPQQQATLQQLTQQYRMMQQHHMRLQQMRNNGPFVGQVSIFIFSQKANTAIAVQNLLARW